MHLTRTTHAHHTASCASKALVRDGSTAPTAGATGTRAAHTQLKSRRRGVAPAPGFTQRHRSAGHWDVTSKTPVQLGRLLGATHFPRCCQRSTGRYNRQGRKAKDRRSMDNHINRGYTRAQTVRNTGDHNQSIDWHRMFHKETCGDE